MDTLLTLKNVWFSMLCYWKLRLEKLWIMYLGLDFSLHKSVAPSLSESTPFYSRNKLWISVAFWAIADPSLKSQSTFLVSQNAKIQHLIIWRHKNYRKSTFKKISSPSSQSRWSFLRWKFISGWFLSKNNTNIRLKNFVFGNYLT